MSPINERPRFAAKSKSTAADSPDMILIGRLILAAVLLILGAFVIKNQIVRVILLALSAIASAFDLGLKAFDSVLERDYFATPILVLFIAFVSFLIGYPTEGAAMLLLYQLSLIVVDYARKRTRSAALELLNGDSDEILDQAGELFANEDAGKLQMTYVFSKGIYNGYIKMMGDKRIKGDVNEDEAVNTADFVALVRIILGKTVPAEPRAADLNKDGVTDVKDLLVLKKILRS